LEQVCNKLFTTCSKLDGIIRLVTRLFQQVWYSHDITRMLQGCSNKSDTVMINKNVTRLTTQGCNNIVISWLYRTCWNNPATSLIIRWQVGTSSANTTCWRLVGRLATRCETFACEYDDPIFLTWCCAELVIELVFSCHQVDWISHVRSRRGN
jgi:hypothetical protein